jgi:hypothetical protein
MTMGGRTTAVGVFRTREEAERAIHDLKRAGFTDDQIGMMMQSEHDERTAGARRDDAPTAGTVDLDSDRDTKAPEGAGAGAVGGGLVGGVLGAIAAGAIPGIGPIIAVGALAGILGGAAAGAAAGGIVGALVGMGVPEEEAKYYEDEVRTGKALVTVDAAGRYDEAVSILRSAGAYDAHSRPTTDTTFDEERRY